MMENVCGKSLAWGSEMWAAGLDLKKVFDHIKHDLSTTRSSRPVPASVTPVVRESIWKCWR